MAIWKRESSSPTRSQRIDGQQWNVNGQGGTIHGWGYPVRRPSAQFTRYNADAQWLDHRFAALTGAQQAAWNEKAELDEDWLICQLIFDYYNTYGVYP